MRLNVCTQDQGMNTCQAALRAGQIRELGGSEVQGGEFAQYVPTARTDNLYGGKI